MGKYVILLLVLLAGVLQPVQVAMNTKLSKTTGSPLLAVMITFFSGGLIASTLWAAGLLGRGQPALLGHAPWWAWLTGPIGILILTTALVALPLSGAALVVAVTVLGQATASLVLDHYGWLDVKQIPVSGWRVAGVLTVLAGVLMMQKQ